jgi:hypothetical protein
MRYLIALFLVAALAAPASAQVASDVEAAYGPLGPGSSAVFSANLTTSGDLFAEDATTVAHALWDPIAGNLLLQSEDLTSASWLTAGGPSCASIVANQGPPGFTDLDSVSCGFLRMRYQSIPWTTDGATAICATAAAVSGTATVSVVADFVSGGSLPGPCWREDGGACTVAGSGSFRYATAVVGTTPTRLCYWPSRGGTAASFVWAGVTNDYGQPGDYPATLIGRVQAARSPVPTPPAYTATTTTAVAAVFRDTKPNAWTNTTAPTTLEPTASPFLPGRAGAQAAPFASSTNYKLGSGSDPLDVADFRACVAFMPATISAQSFLGNGNTTTTGYTVGITAGGACTAQMGTGTVTTTNVAVAGSPNVCCFGRSGTTGSVKLNFGAVASGVVSASVDTARTVNLLTADAGGTGLDGTAYEFIFDASAWTDAWGLDQAARFTGLMPQRGGALSITRTTTGTGAYATFTANGVIWPASDYWPRIEAAGVLVEVARENYVLNSITHPKTTEATASLPTGLYLGWHTGTGTMTIAAGTATISGLTCTAVAAGTVCGWSVTGAGTVLVTTTAGTTAAQIEKYTTSGSAPSSLIVTGAALGARSLEVVSGVWPAGLQTSWCVRAAALMAPTTRVWSSTAPGPTWLEVGSIAAANSARLILIGSAPSFRVHDAAGTARTAQGNFTGTTTGVPITAMGCSDRVGVARFYRDGANQGNAIAGGTGLWGAVPTIFYIGGSASTAMQGWVRDVRICNATAIASTTTPVRCR